MNFSVVNAGHAMTGAGQPVKGVGVVWRRSRHVGVMYQKIKYVEGYTVVPLDFFLHAIF
jgi:hypothetical protein